MERTEELSQYLAVSLLFNSRYWQGVTTPKLLLPGALTELVDF